MNRKSIIIACTVIIIAAALHANSVRATEAAHQGSVAANWCNYLGPDCHPYGLSHKAHAVFRYLTQPESMSGVDRGDAYREILRTQEAVNAGDPVACKEARDLAKAMRRSPSPDMRRWGRNLFDLAGRKCD